MANWSASRNDMMLKFYYILIAVMGFFVSCSVGLPIEKDWAKPSGDIYNLDWRKNSPTKFLSAAADFNGDGLEDSVLILEGETEKRFGLFVFLKTENGWAAEKLFDTKLDKRLQEAIKNNPEMDLISKYARSYGVKIVEPGSYTTACGKGYYECEADSDDEYVQEELLLKNPAIELFHYDAGGTRYFFWDNIKKEFLFAWMDD